MSMSAMHTCNHQPDAILERFETKSAKNGKDRDCAAQVLLGK